MRTHCIDIRVRYSETDQMGIVYHGDYAQYFEIGRVEWMRNIGVFYKKMEEQGIILPIMTLHILFKKPATYDELISVSTTLRCMPTRKIEFDYEITNSTGEILTTASTALLFLNKETRKPMYCPDYILDKLADMKF